jgi:hypothetical protein
MKGQKLSVTGAAPKPFANPISYLSWLSHRTRVRTAGARQCLQTALQHQRPLSQRKRERVRENHPHHLPCNSPYVQAKRSHSHLLFVAFLAPLCPRCLTSGATRGSICAHSILCSGSATEDGPVVKISMAKAIRPNSTKLNQIGPN